MIDPGISALMIAFSGGIGWLAKAWVGRAGQRETELSRRENEYQERIDKQLTQIEQRFSRLERSNTVLVGVVHVIIDDLDPESSTLEAIAALLRDAYPVMEDTPADLLNLTARLDAKVKRRKRA